MNVNLMLEIVRATRICTTEGAKGSALRFTNNISLSLVIATPSDFRWFVLLDLVTVVLIRSLCPQARTYTG